MKTLVLNASPVENGNTVFLINNFISKISTDFELINLYQKNISPCIDCRACFNADGCVINDDATEIINKINDCDLLVVASPLHYNQPASVYLTLASRFQCVFAQNTKNEQSEHKNTTTKNAVVILCGGGDCVVNPLDAEKTIRITLMSLNIKVVAYIHALHTSKINAKNDEQAREEIEKAVEVVEGLRGIEEETGN